MPEQNNEFWDRVSGNYSFDGKDPFFVFDQSKFHHVQRHLARHGVSPKRVLEVGCGSATMSTFFAKAGSEAHALDVSPGALQAAKARLAHNATTGSLYQGDAFRLPFRDGSFDLVMSCGLLEHFTDMTPVVREMTRVLRPGGVSFQDIVPRKFSLNWVMDIPLLGMGYFVNKVRGAPDEAAMLKDRVRYNLDFFRDEKLFNEAAIGGYEVRIGAKGIERVMHASGLAEVEVRGSGVLPVGLLNQGLFKGKDLSGLYPLVHRTDNTRWASHVGVGFFAFGRKPVP